MEKKKKLFILISSMCFGGAERVVSILLQELKDYFDITLVLQENVIDYNIPKNQKIVFIGQQEKNLSKFKKILNIPKLSKEYGKLCAQQKPDVSFSFMYRSNFVNGFSRRHGNPAQIIVSERNFPSKQYKNKTISGTVAKILISKSYNKADLVVTNAKRSALDLQDNFKVTSKMVTIYNPIPIDKYLNKVAPKKKQKEIFTFINIANLFRYKNHDLLVKAFAKLKGDHLRLQIIGEGENRVNLTQMIKELGQENRITLLGQKSNIEDYLNNADCFILSSFHEGFPNVLLEALSFSLPVISTDCLSGPRELLSPSSSIKTFLKDKLEIAEHGILVPVDHVDLMHEAMETMCNKPELREQYSKIALQRAKMFDTPIIVEHFKDQIINA